MSKFGAKRFSRTKICGSLSSRSAEACVAEGDQPKPAPDSKPKALRLASLLSLPTELLLQILEFLSTLDATCLSLTCRELYLLINQHRIIQPSAPWERMRLLRRFEQDLAQYILCYKCEKLYLWRKWSNDRRRWRFSLSFPFIRSITRPRLEHCKSSSWIYLCDKNHHRKTSERCGLCPTFRRLILRHELLGPDFGIPMSTLTHSCKAKAVKGTPDSSITIEPKIVRRIGLTALMSNPMIRKTTQVTFREKLRLGEIYRYQPVIAWDLSKIVCQHVGVALLNLSQHAARFLKQSRHDSCDQELGMDKDVLSFKAPFNTWYQGTKLLKCHICSTDFRIYTRASNEKIFEVKFDVFQDFGCLHDMYQALPLQQARLFDGCPKPVGTHNGITNTMLVHRLNPDLEKLYNEQETSSKIRQYSICHIRKRHASKKYFYPFRDALENVAFAAQYQRECVPNDDAPYPLCLQLDKYIHEDWYALGPWINAGRWINRASRRSRTMNILDFELCRNCTNVGE